MQPEVGSDGQAACSLLPMLGVELSGVEYGRVQLRIRLNFGIFLAEHILPGHKELDARSYPAN